MTNIQTNNTYTKYTHFTIFLDSFSCLQSLHSMNIDYPYILDVLYNYYYVSNQDKIVKICWIPSHIGIKLEQRSI